MGIFGKKNETSVDLGRQGLLPDGTRVHIKQEIDCIGDSCPRPQLMTKKALAGAAAGDVFAVLIDNPTSMEAIPPMMKDLNSTHLGTVKADRCWRVYVRKN